MVIFLWYLRFQLVTGVIDSTLSCNFIYSHSVTRGNRYKRTQKHVHYNLTKFFFANRIVPIGNSLPCYVVSACLVEVFEKRLDLSWRNKENMYNYKATMNGIGNRSVIESV